MLRLRRTARAALRLAPQRWVLAPLEPILHASPWRLRLLGLTALLGHPVFGWVWSQWLVQPYENWWLRALMSLLGAVLMLPVLGRDISHPATQLLVTLIMWIELPVFFSWMYLCNDASPAWLGTVCAVTAFYYHLTDWRIATLGMASGTLLSWAAFAWLVPAGPQVGAVDAVVIGFSWGCSILLGLSSANLRREQLSHTLFTMGIMAHELRTPLSTAALIADAVQLEVQRQPAHPRAAKLDQLGQRLHVLVRAMNHQIDTQIANAKLLQLPRHTEEVSAAALVQEVSSAYPYASSRQRECVQVLVHRDFVFHGSPTQFSQVLSNLMKNALHALTAADSAYPLGALRIEVDHGQRQGCIRVADAGIGIAPSLLPHIFKPFFSSRRSTGHGLGLAFCQQVVKSAGGSIEVKAGHPAGAIFTVTLPLAPARRH